MLFRRIAVANRAHQISGANEVEWCEDEEQRQDIENASPGRQDGGSGQNRSEGSRQHRKTPSMMDAMGFFNGAPQTTEKVFVHANMIHSSGRKSACL